MRNLLLSGLGLAAVAAAAIVTALVAPAPAPSPPPEVTAILPPLPEAQPVEAAPAVPPTATLDATLPPLPVAEVAPRVVHEVPEYEVPATPHVTFQDRDGRSLAHALPAPQSLPPTPAAADARAPIWGPALATGPATLMVAGHAVRLFGVRPPVDGDRCATGNGPARACGETAREMLTARLRASPLVDCRAPPGARGHDPARVCVDARGVDLAGLLAAEGLVLADQSQGTDYLGAEGVARTFRKGLWFFR